VHKGYSYNICSGKRKQSSLKLTCIWCDMWWTSIWCAFNGKTKQWIKQFSMAINR